MGHFQGAFSRNYTSMKIMQMAKLSFLSLLCFNANLLPREASTFQIGGQIMLQGSELSLKENSAGLRKFPFTNIVAVRLFQVVQA